MIDREYIYTLYCAGAGAILKYLEQLDSRIELAQSQVETSQNAKIDFLEKELAATRQTIDRQKQQLLESQQSYHQLLVRIYELEREIAKDSSPQIERDSHNSSLPPSHDLPWQKVKRTRSLRKKSNRKPGGQSGHPGKTLLRVEQPDEIILHALKVCPKCNDLLDSESVIDSMRRQVFDIAYGKLTATEHQAKTLRCPNCFESVRARFPSSVRAPIQYGTGVLSRLVYLHLYQLIPINRTKEIMRDLFGCNLSEATIERAVSLVSNKLVRSEQRIKASIQESKVIGVDETGLRVAADGFWIHVARTETLTHYGFDKNLGAKAMNRIGIIPKFKGTLVRDGFPSYKWFTGCKHSLCNAHLLRELVYVEELDPIQKAWTTPLTKLLVKIKDSVEVAKKNGKQSLDETQINKWLTRFDKIIKKANKLNPSHLPKIDQSQMIKKKPDSKPKHLALIKRLRLRRDDFLRFMTDFSAPFDNNGSERDLRMVKLQQKISGCFRTSEGAKKFCRVRSYLSTARKNGYSLLHSIERAINGKPLY